MKLLLRLIFIIVLLNSDFFAQSQIAEGMVTCGISTQFLKHITGRKTPIKATQSGGVWSQLQ